jgi:hypothetical protein
MDIGELVKGAALELEATIEQEDQVYFLTVTLDDEEEPDEEVASEVVMVYADDDGETLIASVDVGACSEDTDLAAVLRGLGSVVYSRVYLGDAEEDGEHLYVEAGLPLPHLTATELAPVVQEVAEIADWLDELLLESE